jgi:alpha-methylacyl-CoA racemase
MVGDQRKGPLAGLRVLEFAGLGPAPHAAMVLADLGADVVRIDRPGLPALGFGASDPLLRGRRRVTVDLKEPDGRTTVLDLVVRADVLVEGFRPGVMERLGLGPDDCLAVNPGLVYGRVTGWGQDGALAQDVGHDINYIGLTGALHAMGRAGSSPAPPLNLVGDFGGGSMLLLVGVLSAVWERTRSGRGQVVDAAMVDGTALLSHMTMVLRGVGGWTDERQSNLLDGGAPFYDTYPCADGRFVAVGALEPRFFAALLHGLGIDPDSLGGQLDRDGWPDMRQRFTAAFASRGRDEWAEHFTGTEACVTPVLTFGEAVTHPHLSGRGTYVVANGLAQPAPAPRFSRTPPGPIDAPVESGEPTRMRETTTAEVRAAWSPRQSGRERG